MTTNEQWNGQFRHLLTTVSGILVMKGITSAEEAELYSQLAWILPGVFLFAVGTVKSWRSKTNIDKEAELIERVLMKVEERIQNKNANGGA